MKACFCGCGRTIPRFPLGIRAINKRGRLVSERVAWARAIARHEADPVWLDRGDTLIAELRAAMHGELDPRSLDESAVRDWQRVGWALEADAAMHGHPPINAWLGSPEASARASEAAQGISAEGRAPSLQSKGISDSATFDASTWLDQAAVVCADAFEPGAERMLQLGTLKMLELDSFDGLEGDIPAATVSSTRLGYALRNWECQQMPFARRDISGDSLAVELDECNASPYAARNMWLPRVIHDVIAFGEHGGVDGALEGLPGAPAEIRREALVIWGERWPSDDVYTGKRATRELVLFGYLLHRVYEIRPELLDE